MVNSCRRSREGAWVVCRLADERIDLRIRLRVIGLPPWKERAGPVASTPGFARPADVLDDRLRLQLHVRPDLLDGKLLCRLVGRGDVRAGNEDGSRWTFAIPLDRWRDHFGAMGAGRVQVRVAGRWLDIVDLAGIEKPGPERVAVPVLPLPLPQPIARLAESAFRDDRDETLPLISECQRRADSPNTPPIEREQLCIANAAALQHLGRPEEAAIAIKELAERHDLHEAGSSWPQPVSVMAWKRPNWRTSEGPYAGVRFNVASGHDCWPSMRTARPASQVTPRRPGRNASASAIGLCSRHSGPPSGIRGGLAT